MSVSRTHQAPEGEKVVTMSEHNSARRPDGRPFCFQYEDDLQHILDEVEGLDAAFCLAVYTALTRIANQERSTAFRRTVTEISRVAGMKYRKTYDILKLLEAIGLLTIASQGVAGTKFRGPSVYTLCTTCKTLCTEESPFHAESIQEVSINNTPFSPKRRMTTTEKKRKRVVANTPTMERIGAWFNRKPGTLWTVAAADALSDINPSDDELDAMERFYRAEFPADRDYRRREVSTLLNNWNGELDKARRWSHESTPKRGTAGICVSHGGEW